MKRNKPSSFGFKINDKINDKINEIHQACLANKSLIARAIVNFGLNELFENNNIKNIDWQEFEKLCLADNAKNPTTKTANFQITEVQQADLLLLPVCEILSPALVLRYVFSIGFESYEKKAAKIRADLEARVEGELYIEVAIKDLIVLNCWG